MQSGSVSVRGAEWECERERCRVGEYMEGAQSEQ